ncbi:hypothetical protein [Streptomyces sp. NPDC013181]|uniref:hypothetical protein n=1 Tax=Streptomyces sp. NPDC013181 TaxID=3364864 RepID=UPI0036AF391C
MTPPARTLLRLHAVAPALGAADLARAVSRVLTGEDAPPGGWRAGRRGQVLRYGGAGAEVIAAWDGPELRLRYRGEPAAATRAAGLLHAVAAAAAGTDPVPGEVPAPRTDTPAYRAWRELMARWRVPDDDLAEITAPGRLTALSDHPRPPEEAAFVYDHIGPPEPPPGWLLREWFAPDTGLYHCSAPPGTRPTVRCPDPAAAPRRTELLTAWQSLVAHHQRAV